MELEQKLKLIKDVCENNKEIKETKKWKSVIYNICFILQNEDLEDLIEDT